MFFGSVGPTKGESKPVPMGVTSRWSSQGGRQRHAGRELRRNPPSIADQQGEIPRSRRTLPPSASEATDTTCEALPTDGLFDWVPRARVGHPRQGAPARPSLPRAAP